MSSVRLRSLWDIMHTVDGREFALAFQSVTSFSQMLISTMEPNYSWCGPEDAVNILKANVDQLHSACEKMELNGPVASLERIRELLGFLVPVEGRPGLFGMPHYKMPAFKGAFLEVGGRIQDEMRGRNFLAMTREESRLYDAEEPPFGEAVANAFPDCLEDIEEAAKCRALGRSTACVFHLMRAAEGAAAVVSSRLGGETHKSDGEPLTFGGLFKQVSDKIAAMSRRADKDPWLKLKGFMSSLNRGTRTKVAHPGTIFSEQQAERLYDQAKAFMEEAEELLRTE